MTVPTHIIAYIFTTNAFGVSLTLHGSILGITGCLLPDIDNINGGIGKVLRPVSTFIHQTVGHRTLFHSWVMVLIAFIISLVIKFFINDNQAYLFLLGVCSHILLDMINISGVRFFYPDRLVCVMPSEQEYRIGTASKREKRFAFAIFILMVITMPFSIWGYETTFRYLAGSHTAAIEEYKKYVDTNEIYVVVREGINRVTQERVKDKKFKVIAAMPKKLTLVEDDAGNRITIGNVEEAIIETKKMDIIKGADIKTEILEIQSRDWKEILNALEYPYTYAIGYIELDETKPLIISNADKWEGLTSRDNIIQVNYSDYKALLTLSRYRILSSRLNIRREVSEEGILGPLKTTENKKETYKFIIPARLEALTVTVNQEVKKGDTIAIDPNYEKVRSEIDALRASLHTADVEEVKATAIMDNSIELQKNIEAIERKIKAQEAVLSISDGEFKEAEKARLNHLIKEKETLEDMLKETRRSIKEEKEYIKKKKEAKKKEIKELIKAKETILSNMINKAPVTGRIVNIKQLTTNSFAIEIEEDKNAKPKEL